MSIFSFIKNAAASVVETVEKAELNADFSYVQVNSEVYPVAKNQTVREAALESGLVSEDQLDGRQYRVDGEYVELATVLQGGQKLTIMAVRDGKGAV